MNRHDRSARTALPIRYERHAEGRTPRRRRRRLTPKQRSLFPPNELCRSSTRFISCPWIPCPARPFLRNPIEPQNFRHSRGFRRYLEERERASWRHWSRIFSRFRFPIFGGVDTKPVRCFSKDIRCGYLYTGLVSRRGDSVRSKKFARRTLTRSESS